MVLVNPSLTVDIVIVILKRVTSLDHSVYIHVYNRPMLVSVSTVSTMLCVM